MTKDKKIIVISVLTIILIIVCICNNNFRKNFEFKNTKNEKVATIESTNLKENEKNKDNNIVITKENTEVIDGTNYVNVNITSDKCIKKVLDNKNNDQDLTGENSIGTTFDVKVAERIDNDYAIKIILANGKEIIKTPDDDNWFENDELLVFNNGSQCEDVTGGWRGYYTDGDNPDVGNAVIEGNNMEINIWGIWCSYGFETMNDIDFTGYSYVVFEIEESTRIWDIIGYSVDNCNFSYGIVGHTETIREAFDSKRVYKLDISQYTSGKIGLYACNQCSIKCSKIYLEK